MSDPVVDEVVAPAAPESPTRAGFTVILKEDGSLLFNILGDNCGAVELLGLQSYADTQISNITAMAVGDAKHGMALALRAIHDKLSEKNKAG